MEVNQISGAIVNAAMAVHSALGPGLLESVYRKCLEFELRQRGFRVETEWPLPIRYGGVQLDAGYRIDLLVEDQVIVELKSVQRILPIHEAQTISHLRLSGRPVGLLINFNVARLRNGIRRFGNLSTWPRAK